jgi:hypothetical protein
MIDRKSLSAFPKRAALTQAMACFLALSNASWQRRSISLRSVMAHSVVRALRQTADEAPMKAIGIALDYLRRELIGELKEFFRVFVKEMKVIDEAYRKSGSYW